MAGPITIELKGIDNATQVVNHVKVSLNQLQGTAQTAGDGITGSLRRIGETALGFLTAQAVPALIGMGRQALSVATDYQSAMNIMQAVSGATADQMALVGQRAQELGADMSLPATSAGDAALAMTELVKAGLSVAEAMESARGVLQLSAAGQLGNAQAAQIAANALNAYRNAANGAALSSSDMGRVADMLAAAANASSASVNDLALGMQMSAANAASAGVPFQSLVTMLGMMSNAGIQGSDAGTSLKTMLMRLQSPTDKAAGLMQNLGIKIYDANGSMNSIQSIIGQFSGSLGGLTQEQRNAALATIFGTDAIRAANIVLMGGVGAFDQMSGAVGRQGAAADLAKAQMAGLGGAFQGLKSQVETALLQLTLPALPWLEGLVRQIADAVPKAVEQVQALASGVMTALASFQAGLAAGPGTATANLLAAVGLSQEAAGQAGALVAQIVAATQAGLAQIQAAWATNGPAITAFVSQILSILGQLAGFLANELPAAITLVTSAIALLIANWQAVATVAGLVAGAIVGSQIAALVTALAGAFSLAGSAAAAAGGIIPLVGVVVAALGGPITIVIALVGALAVAWATNFMGIRDITAQAWAGIQAAFAAGQAAVGAAVAWVQQAWGQLTTAVTTAWTVIQVSTAMAWATVTTTITTAVTSTQAAIAGWWAGVTGAFTAGWAAVTGATSAAWAAIVGAWTAGVAAVTAVATAAWSVITAVFNVGWSVVQGVSSVAWAVLSALFGIGMALLQAVVSTAWAAIAAVWTAAVAQIQAVTTPVIQVLQALWSAGMAVLQSVTTAAWGAITSTWNAALAALQAVTAPAWAALQSAWTTGTNAIQTATSTAWATMTTTWNTAWMVVQTVTAVAWAAIATAFGTAWGQLTSATATAWGQMTTAWNTAWGILQTVTAVAWAAVATAWSQTWAQLQAITAPAWSAVQGTWNSAWSALQGLTTSAWNAVQGAWNSAWGNVRSNSASAWSQTQSDWSSKWSSLQSLTSAAWSNVQGQWNTAWNAVKATNPQAWGQVETAWTTGWTNVQTTTATAWTTIVGAWQQAWAVVTGLTGEAWTTVNGIWAEAVAFAQGLMDRLGEAFNGVSAAIRGTIAALKKLADTAASLANAIPDWMRPGSPMPLGIAFEHLAGATADAAAGLKQVGGAMAGAAGRVTLGLDLQLTLNGRSVGSGADTGAMADNVSKTMQLLTTVMGVVGQAITFWNNEQQRFAISTAAGRGWISGIADFLGQLGADLINVLAPSLGRLNQGAAAAAKTFGESLAPIQSLTTVMTFTTAAIAFWNDATQRMAISTAAGRGWIAGIAGFLSILAALIVNEMRNAAGLLAGGAADGAARLGNALKPIQDLGAVMTFTALAIAFWNDATQRMAISTAAGRGWIAGIAGFLAQLGALILNEMSSAATLLQAGAVAGAQSLSAGLQALQGLTSVMGLAPGILALWNDAGQNALVMTAAGRDVAKQVVAALVALGVAWLQELNTGASQVTGVNEAATSAAAKLVNLTVGFVTDTIQIVNTVNGYLKAGGLSLDVTAAREFVRKLVVWGIALATEFETGTATYTGQVTPAATEFSKSIDLLAKVTDDIAKFEEKVGKVDVRSASDLEALKTKIGTAIDQLKGLVQVFLDGANAFTGQPLIGAENLTKGMDQLQKIISDQAAVLKKLDDTDLSISADTETKVVRAIEAAKRLVALFFESGNTTPAVGNSLGDQIRELVQGLSSLGSLGSVADAALAAMQTLMATLVGVAAEAGRNAGTAFVTQMAAAIRAGGSALTSAVGDALAGAGGSGREGQRAAASSTSANGVTASVTQYVTVNMSTAMGLDSTLTLLLNMAKG